MPPKIIINSKGEAIKTQYCDCGKILHKKNLTTGAIEVAVPREKGEELKFAKQTNLNDNNPSIDKYECAYCGKEHIVAGIKESISFVEEVENSLAPELKKDIII